MSKIKRILDWWRGAVTYAKMTILLRLFFLTRSLEDLEERVKTIQPNCTYHGNKRIYRLPRGGVAIFDYTTRSFEINPKPHAQ